MDKLILEPEIEKKQDVKQEIVQEPEVKSKIVLHKERIEEQQFCVSGKAKQNTEISTDYSVQNFDKKKDDGLESYEINSYVASFENKTIEEIKKEQAERESEILRAEVEKIKKQEVDGLQEIDINEIPKCETLTESESLTTVTKLVIEKPNYDFIPSKKKKNKKMGWFRSVVLAIAVAICGIGCVTGSVIIDNMSSQYIELQDKYEINLWKYLRNIESLNATDKTLDFVETYPEEINEISSIGESTNWFNEITDYVSGIFGG